MNSSAQKTIQVTILIAAFAWSMINPYNNTTWFLDALPAISGVIILASVYNKFRFTNFNYWMVIIHCIILLIGAHYTYAREPLFNYIKELLDLSRNNYDKIGHFAQGFFPALIVRELLIRTSPLRPGKWLFFVVVSVALAFSAFYEMFEWWTAVYLNDVADDFIGAQGYVWDTQSDMFFAMTGSILSQIIFKNYLDKKITETKKIYNNPDLLKIESL